jgi:DNA-binding CsgD family transcriptional regulator/PAS domain-containing protein
MSEDLIRTIYEASLDPDHWVTAIDQLSSAIGAHGGHLLLWDEASAAPLFSRQVGMMSADADRLFAEYYGAIDPRRQHVMTRPVGEWIGCHQICDEQFVARSEFYQDFMIPTVGCRYMTGVRLDGANGQHALLALGRRPGRQSKPFEESDLAPIRALTQHLALAVRLQARLARLEARAQLRDEALDRLAMAVLVVDRGAAVQYANRAGEALLGDPDGPIDCILGRLRPRATGAACGFELRVRSAVDRAMGGALSLPWRSGQNASHCVFVPVASGRRWGGAWVRPMTMILVTEARPDCRVDPAVLQALFGLTPSESRLASALASGTSLETFAAGAAISPYTARAHLRAVFSKTGVNRQAELVAILGRLGQLKPDA